jgi:hypothetical protein
VSSEKWLVAISTAVVPPGVYTFDAGLVQAFRIIITDLDNGEVLVDREFEAKYETVGPVNCNRNSAGIKCSTFNATWN